VTSISRAGDARPIPLSRRLGLADAVVIGLGAMIGAGIFAAIGPAADAAGSWLLAGVAIAGGVAYCNAMSSAWLAARHPESGGTYVYGRRRLGGFWGYLAGWGFVVGKLASCGAMALTFGSYVAPGAARPLAVAAVVALVAVNLGGVRRTAQATRVIVALVLAALAATVTAALAGGEASIDRLTETGGASPTGVMQAGAFFFFAFAGYARIATLGEEVRDPERTIPRAIPLALAITLALYALVAASALAAVGPSVLAAADAPLAAAVADGSLSDLEPVVRVGAAIASLGVLLSLIAGVSRTALAMGRTGDLPRWLAAVHPTRRIPHHAEMAVGVVVIAIVIAGDLTAAIGFSSFAVLTYYAIANASAWTLPRGHSRGSRAIPLLGLAGCVALALTLPIGTVLAGAGVLTAGAALWIVRRQLARSRRFD
jgi:basic amino acid/polyamine antiporter, APA family